MGVMEVNYLSIIADKVKNVCHTSPLSIRLLVGKLISEMEKDL
jgi:hypothetical protein